MQDFSQNNRSMFQRRIIYFIIRGVLLLLGVLLLWRMITIISTPDSPKLVDEHVIAAPKVDPVLVTVYYESMCPDSKYFIRHQLVPTVEKVSEILDFKLIPYGKAKTIENTTGIFFTCQHRELECIGNKIHACGIKYIESQAKLLSYVSCLINNINNPQSVGESCAKEVGATWDVINQCSISQEGSELLKQYGEETHNLNPSVSFIPTITLDKSQGGQKDILKDLLKEVCSRYKRDKPSNCL